MSDEARLAFLLPEEATQKLLAISLYMKKEPYYVVVDSIERMYSHYVKINEEKS